MFPAIGTVYPSVLAFKLDSHERALRHSLNVTTATSVPGIRQETVCGIRPGPAKTRYNYCSCRVVAKKIDGTVRVTEVNQEHTCTEKARKENKENASLVMAVKIDKLKAQLAEEEQGFVRPDEGRKEEEEEGEDVFGSSAHSESESSEEEDSEEYVEPEEQSEHSERDDRDEADGSEGSEEREDERVDEEETRQRDTTLVLDLKVRARVLFPTARDLRLEAARLNVRGPTSLPSSNQRFDTARDLLVVLYAYAQERGFALYRYSPYTQLDHLTMICNQYYCRNPSAGEARCLFKIHCKTSSRDGKWRFLKTEGSHNHRTTAVLSADSHSRQDAASSSSALRPSSQSSTPSSLPPRSNATVKPRPSSTLSRSSSTLSRSSSTLSRFPSDLVSFLRSFESSPSALNDTLTALDEAGVTRLDDLVLLLSMSQESLERFAGHFEAKVGLKLRIMASELRSELSIQ
ncbi:uncharacterized protein JCM6883_002046 [Sporobolomyces salmoneus]|uniref:uncharacterized protein n=1 Tax=Sporobolomyces salmoneus TaxID=183962 RepID=UPI00317A3104